MASRSHASGMDASPPPAWAAAFEAAVMQADLIIANTMEHRWLSPTDARDAIREGYRLWTALLAQTGELMLRALGERIEGNGYALPGDAGRLVSQMGALDTRCLVLLPGLAAEDFAKVLEILAAAPDELRALGGFAECAKRVGLSGVAARSFVLREVTEDEVVVRRDGASAARADDPHLRAALLAFLGGHAREPDAAVREVLLGADAGSAAAVEALAEAAGPFSEDRAADAARLAEGVRRVFDLWMGSGEAATQKGRRECARRLRLLKDGLAERLHDAGGAGEAVLLEACETMDDELKMDSLASEYLKRRRAISESESRILRYMRRKGLDGLTDSELEQRMLQGGLDTGEWRHLLVRSGVASTGESEESVAGLSGRLTELEERLRGGKLASSPVQLADELKTIALQVDVLADDTNRKVRDILEEYRSDAEPAAGGTDEKPKAPRMTRKQLYGKLSEIAQEICQPLSVISCSITMITSGRIGILSSPQTEILNLAVDSAHKLKVIADSLMQIAGLPDELEPNAAIQREIYGA
jgi:hypothetical protein